jgi:hypothetical protein
MGEQPKYHSTLLRVALVIFCAAIFYFGAIFVTLVAWDGVYLGPAALYRGGKPNGDIPVRTSAPMLQECYDQLGQEDFGRRLAAQHTRPTVAILGAIGGCLLIAQLLFSRNCRTAEPPSQLPPWLRGT